MINVTLKLWYALINEPTFQYFRDIALTIDK